MKADSRLHIDIKKIWKMSITLFKCRFFGKVVPFSVLLTITNQCDQRCSYCAFWSRPQEEMDTRQALYLIDELAKLGCYRLGFCGGEPLLRADIGVLIERAKHQGMFTSLDSNGNIVERRIDALTNLDLYIASMDGPEEIHDKHRCKGSFQRQVKAIKLLRERGIRVWTYTPLSKYNCTQEIIDRILSLGEELDIEIGFATVMNMPYATTAEVSNLMPTEKEFRECLRYILEVKRKNRRIIASEAYLKQLMKWPIMTVTRLWPNNKKEPPLVECWAGKMHFDIDANGDVYPCIPFFGQGTPLNVFKDGFTEALAAAVSLKEGCRGCTLAALSEINHTMSLKFSTIIHRLRQLPEFFSY